MAAVIVAEGVEAREIEGFPGYAVSADGVVWSHRTRYGEPCDSWRPKKTRPDRIGYASVGLYRNGRELTRRIHSLVMNAWIGPRPDGQEVCHGNGDRMDCRLSNLRYDTHLANEADKKRMGRGCEGENHPMAKLNAQLVADFRRRIASGEATRKQLAIESGFAYKTICGAVAGRRWKCVSEEMIGP